MSAQEQSQPRLQQSTHNRQENAGKKRVTWCFYLIGWRKLQVILNHVRRPAKRNTKLSAHKTTLQSNW